MSVTDGRIEVAFGDEWLRIKHEGLDALLKRRLDELLFDLYRAGYLRGHGDHAREVHQQQERDRRAGIYPQHVEIKYEADRLVIEGKDRTPQRPMSQDGTKSQE